MCPMRKNQNSQPWLRTVWEGHRYPPFFVCHFRHDVRVRRTPDGRIEAEFFDDESRIPGAGGKVWRRIIRTRLAEKLYAQVTSPEDYKHA